VVAEVVLVAVPVVVAEVLAAAVVEASASLA
jgi:hypothetical protein